MCNKIFNKNIWNQILQYSARIVQASTQKINALMDIWINKINWIQFVIGLLKQHSLNKWESITAKKIIIMQIMIITTKTIMKNKTRKIIINTSKIIIKGNIKEMINIIMEIRNFNEKIYINIIIKINMKTDLIKIKREIIRSLINIA